jgi:hypothetical protein
MTPEKQRIAIATACGYSKLGTRTYSDYGDIEITAYLNGEFCDVPNYLNDLNAMHEAEETLDPICQCRYAETLYRLMIGDHAVSGFMKIHATAAQRAEAFLKTLNLWKP